MKAAFDGRLGMAATLSMLALSAATGVQAAPKGRQSGGPPLYTRAFPPGADAAIAARPATATVSTLRDAIALAYWNNPVLLAQRAQLRATDNRLPAARAGYGPSLSVQGSADYRRDRTEILSGQYATAKGFSTTAALVFNQPLYTFGRNRSAENIARAEIALGRDSLRLAEADTLLNVVSAYVSVRRDTALVAVSQENLRLLTRQYSDSTERFRVREITATDLQQVETRVAFGRAQLLQSQGQLGISRSQFLQTVGALPGALAPAEPLPMAYGTIDQAYAYAEANGPILRAAHAREKISRAGIDAAIAERGPRVDLRGTAGYNPITPYDNALRTTALVGQVVLQMPLVDSGLRRAQVREAREANESDWRLIDSALRDMRQAVAGSWEQMTAARASLADYRQAEDAAQRAYEGALAQEKAGARTTLDVLDLARDLLTVRSSFIGAEANEYIARASLLAAVGRLEAPLLIPDLTPYDPVPYHDRVRRAGDVPLLTDLLAPIDAVTTRDTRTDRAVRDPAGPLRADAVVPMVRETPPRP